PHRVSVARLRQADARAVIVGERSGRAGLAKMLAAGGLDEAVGRVVGVFGARLDTFVAEIDRLLGGVADFGDFGGAVVGIEKALCLAARPSRRLRSRAIAGEGCRVATGEQMNKTERQRVVGIGGGDPVGVIYPRALPLGVVVEVRDEWRGGR